MTTIFWAGDSTVKQNGISTYPQTGIGQVFDRYTRPFQVLIDNCAENGRSTKSFIDEGRLDAIDRHIREGDFLFIQFGHNDEKAEDPSRYADPDGAFRDNLALFVETARRHGATQNIFARLAPFGSQSHRRDHSVACPHRGIYRNRRASAKQRGIFID